jgi:hypothetical protein
VTGAGGVAQWQSYMDSVLGLILQLKII